ncbi:unnamed protein product [Amoebophrya sp. A25]|nr:unnamed protein product [Amoebophrya sp. A25]|eukprot:GSA25T00001451001.1
METGEDEDASPPRFIPDAATDSVPVTLLPSALQMQRDRRKMTTRPTRKETISQKRTEFAKGLFNQDLKQLSEWHRWRSPLEQKKFLKSVDNLYSVWLKKGQQVLEGGSGGGNDTGTQLTILEPKPLTDIPEDGILPSEAGAEAGSVCVAEGDAVDKLMAADKSVPQRIALSDHIGGGPGGAGGSRRDSNPGSNDGRSRGSRSLPSIGGGSAGGASSSSRPKMTPIDLHNDKRRNRRRIYAPESLTLDAWLDANSQASTYSVSTDVSDYSRWTGISEMTETTEGSITSEPLPCMKTQYRFHRRGFAINRRKWRTMRNHDGKKVPDAGYPEDRRFQTSMKNQFPNHNAAILNPLEKDEKMYASVFKPESHPMIADALDTMPAKQSHEFLEMVRCLHQLRKEAKPRTTTEREYDLEENKRLYTPPAAKYLSDPADLRKSSIPLGTLTENLNKYQVQLGKPRLITAQDYAAKTAEVLDLEADPTQAPFVPTSKSNALNDDGTAMSDIFSMGDQLDPGVEGDVFV